MSDCMAVPGSAVSTVSCSRPTMQTRFCPVRNGLDSVPSVVLRCPELGRNRSGWLGDPFPFDLCETTNDALRKDVPCTGGSKLRWDDSIGDLHGTGPRAGSVVVCDFESEMCFMMREVVGKSKALHECNKGGQRVWNQHLVNVKETETYPKEVRP